MEQLSGVNGLPPGLRGYAAAQEMDQQQQGSELQKLHTMMQLQQQQRAQQSQDQVKQILAQNPDPQTAIPALMKAGPAGMQAASSLVQMNEHLTKQKTAADKAAFFSPENQQKYMTGGVQPATPNDDNGNPMPVVPGKMDMGKFMQDAAARNMIPPEAYANHLAQREQAKLALQQAADLKREQIQKDRDIDQQRSEDRSLSQADQNRARMDMIRLTAALRPAPQERMLPVQMPDGSVQYAPASQAAGQTVGKVAPPQNNGKQVQALGKAFETAKVNESHATLSQVEGIVAKTPEVLDYITGPKAMIPDVAVSKMSGGKEILEGRQAFAKLFNITLKDRSGAAVTAPEYARLKEEFGKGLLRDPMQLKIALGQARNTLDQRTKAVAAGFGPQTLAEYNQNVETMGGSPIVTAPSPTAPASGGWGIKRK